MKGKMNIRTRLIGTFAIVMGFALANAAHSSIALRGIRSQLDTEIAASAKMLDESREITLDIANMRSAMRGITLFSLQKNPVQSTKAQSGFETTAAQMRQTLDQMATGRLTEEDRDSVPFLDWLGLVIHSHLTAAVHHVIDNGHHRAVFLAAVAENANAVIADVLPPLLPVHVRTLMSACGPSPHPQEVPEPSAC